MQRTTRTYVYWLMALTAGGWMLAGQALAQDALATRPSDPHGGAAVLEQLTTTHPAEAAAPHPAHEAPSLLAAIPFVVLLLSIAVLPLIPRTAHWWHHNRNKFLMALVLAVITLAYYLARGSGIAFEHHVTEPGFDTVKSVLWHSVFREYIPFMTLLFSLYTISGGIQLRGDVRATPAVNTAFLGLGAVLASFIGTTGASMLFIRPLLQTNRERKHVTHTVIFFIFLVSNIGGSLLPIGDPPLFLGYLRGVPFLWTLRLSLEWGFCVAVLLILYYLWDMRLYRKEPPLAKMLDETQIEPMQVHGKLNFLWLLGVIFALALIVPGERFLGTAFVVPEHAYLRELTLLAFVALGWLTTAPRIRVENQFDFGAILEVAALFIGIFVTMQAPIEILQIKGPALGLTQPWQFFWATGGLSSFLDNAPTYVVFFTTANALTHSAGPGILQLADGNFMQESLLVAISLGAVFMGANTYIGNGPNFMVKSIAEQSGVKMPSFFGYMVYSVGILVPLFIVVTFLFVH